MTARPPLRLEFITTEAERELLERIAEALESVEKTPATLGRSRLRRYGWDYNDTSEWVGDFPDWLMSDWLAQHHTGFIEPFDSVVVNEYAKGSSILAHTDSLAFGDPIQILSLGSTAIMDFKRKCCAMHFFITLPPRSLLILEGNFRLNWTHAVRPVKEPRVSIVFRRRVAK